MVNKIHKFSANWSVLTYLTTIIIGLIVFAMIPYGISTAISTGRVANDAAKAYTFLIGLIPLIFILAVFFAPMKYTVTASEVIINRLGPNILIPIKSINDIRKIQRKEIGFLPLRLFGVGGFCGAYGLFWGSRLGIFRGYITNTKTLILLKYQGNTKVLISPDSPQEFLNAVAQSKSDNSQNQQLNRKCNK